MELQGLIIFFFFFFGGGGANIKSANLSFHEKNLKLPLQADMLNKIHV